MPNYRRLHAEESMRLHPVCAVVSIFLAMVVLLLTNLSQS